MSSLLKNSTIKVSSVLNKDSKTWGKQHLIDSNPETCWNSAPGKTQYIIITTPNQINGNSIQLNLSFQGGFAALKCLLYIKQQDWVLFGTFLYQDVNTDQIFKVDGDSFTASEFKICFQEATDLFGRITLYNMDLIIS